MEELIAAIQLFCVLLLEKCSTLENGVFYEEKIILKSSIPAVAAGLSVLRSIAFCRRIACAVHGRQ